MKRKVYWSLGALLMLPTLVKPVFAEQLFYTFKVQEMSSNLVSGQYYNIPPEESLIYIFSADSELPAWNQTFNGTVFEYTDFPSFDRYECNLLFGNYIAASADSQVFNAPGDISEWHYAYNNYYYELPIASFKGGSMNNEVIIWTEIKSSSELQVGDVLNFTDTSWVNEEGNQVKDLIEGSVILSSISLENPVDFDGDTILNSEDNCLRTFNPDQLDFDQDNIGDLCDDDADGDGFSITEDCQDLDPSINPNQCDIKNDGIDQNCDGFDRLRGKSCSEGEDSNWKDNRGKR